MFSIRHGDCREVLKQLPDCSVDAIVTDPPYELGFMGKAWDSTGVAYQVEVWQECLRVLMAGGHLLAFGGSRTYHRLACAIEDAGFQIRDQIMWVYGSGFPKSLNISKAIDKQAGAEREVIGQKMYARKGVAIAEERTAIGGGSFGEARMGDITIPAMAEAKQWDGWGTALKPAHEPIVMARKPLDGTVAQTVLTHGTGGINIDGCRVKTVDKWEATGKQSAPSQTLQGGVDGSLNVSVSTTHSLGRFPANFIHDGSEDVLELFPRAKGGAYPAKRGQAVNTSFAGGQKTKGGFRAMGDDGSAARFFYCAKASKKDRNEGLDGFEPKREADRIIDDGVGGDNPRNRSNTPKINHHPTVKPTDLMRYLCRLVTPPNGTVLDPFTGSGSTGKAATLEGFNFIGIEQSAEYIEIATARIKHAEQQC